MPVDIIIPNAGESITEVRMGQWHRGDGDWVTKDDIIVEIETDKTTMEVPAPESGLLKVIAHAGEDRRVGDVIGSIDPAGAKPQAAAKGAAKSAAIVKEPAPSVREPVQAPVHTAADGDARATSTARKMAADKGVPLAGIQGTGPAGRITKSDVLAVTTIPAAKSPLQSAVSAPLSLKPQASSLKPAPASAPGSRSSRRERMTKLRERIAERLVEAQHTAAMLTTFNEADMTEVIRLRGEHKEAFEKKHGVGLGFMGFFVKACASALRQFPRVNAYLVSSPAGGPEIEYHDFIDIAVAVGTDKGLVVPVLRNVEMMSFADIELSIKDLATRARDGKLTVEELTGGTFTISNGGVYGSLNSTPILNPPQSGILGMHAIKKRPVEDPTNPGQIALRPMMYLALSYDHRIVDGAEAVSFLVHVKNAIEKPERLLLGV
jgi:2-oxoglutarate dehydrogenase E2 component (dihydrolipoamide succinyltransferase)